jgi:peptide-methionine (S)-S-oxide reductase
MALTHDEIASSGHRSRLMAQPLESPGFSRRVGSCRTLIIAAALLLTAGVALRVSPSVAEGARAIPAPVLAEPATQQMTSEVAIVAGGCFWGVQGIFQHVEGVTSAISGYAGGTRDAARYETVSTGTTGHAEAVRITFDPHRISYGRILQIYFSVAHDPTGINRQGPDVGTQYRSAIFPADQGQARAAEAYITQLNEARVFPAGIATRIEPGQEFYPAEAYHQDYLTLHPEQGYIARFDLPKIANLKAMFPQQYRAEPALVMARAKP